MFVLDDGDELHIGPHSRLHRREVEVRRVGLLVGDRADGKDVAQLHAEASRGLGIHHDFVSAMGVGHPTCSNDDSVLVEVQAVDAAVGNQAGAGRGGVRMAVGQKLGDVDDRCALDASNVGQVADRVRQRGVIAVVGNDLEEVGGVPAGEERRK